MKVREKSNENGSRTPDTPLSWWREQRIQERDWRTENARGRKAFLRNDEPIQANLRPAADAELIKRPDGYAITKPFLESTPCKKGQASFGSKYLFTGAWEYGVTSSMMQLSSLPEHIHNYGESTEYSRLRTAPAEMQYIVTYIILAQIFRHSSSLSASNFDFHHSLSLWSIWLIKQEQIKFFPKQNYLPNHLLTYLPTYLPFDKYP